MMPLMKTCVVVASWSPPLFADIISVLYEYSVAKVAKTWLDWCGQGNH